MKPFSSKAPRLDTKFHFYFHQGSWQVCYRAKMKPTREQVKAALNYCFILDNKRSAANNSNPS